MFKRVEQLKVTGNGQCVYFKMHRDATKVHVVCHAAKAILTAHLKTVSTRNLSFTVHGLLLTAPDSSFLSSNPIAGTGLKKKAAA